MRLLPSDDGHFWRSGIETALSAISSVRAFERFEVEVDESRSLLDDGVTKHPSFHGRTGHVTIPPAHPPRPVVFGNRLRPRPAFRPPFGAAIFGAVLARGRRTVTSWIRAAGLSAEFRPCYATFAAAGKRADGIAARLVHAMLRPLLSRMGRLAFALDDTPTERYGPEVQGAGVHHNPTPGPAGSPFVYGHVWVVLGLLAIHPLWGVIALPLLARLYIRRKDLAAIDNKHRPAFATKLELAVALLGWAKCWLGFLGQPLWVVADGAYAKAAFLKKAIALGFVVVSRLHKDAALWSVPDTRPPGKRGRPRIYGQERIRLAKRAGQSRGWQTGTFALYRKAMTKRYKTFLATWCPAGGVIRVVLVNEPAGWMAFFSTDPDATVADILGLVAVLVEGGKMRVRRLLARQFSHSCPREEVADLLGYAATKNVPSEAAATSPIHRSYQPTGHQHRRLTSKLEQHGPRFFSQLKPRGVWFPDTLNVLASSRFSPTSCNILPIRDVNWPHPSAKPSSLQTSQPGISPRAGSG